MISPATRRTDRPRVGATWTRRGQDYAEILEGFFRPLYESVLARSEVSQAKSVLDIGCGPGLAARFLSQKIPVVAAIDATPAFIEIARRTTTGRSRS